MGMTMMSIILRLAAAAASIVVPVASHAQTSAAAPGPDPAIVVEGRKGEIRNEIKNLLETDGDQLARFETDFCPKVIGFDREWTPIVERLIRENVAEIGMEVEPEPCQPTAIVIFTFEPKELVEGLRTRMPGLFEGMNLPELDRLTAEKKGAYSWRAVDMRSREGIPLQNVSAIGGEMSNAKVVRNAVPSRLVRNVRFEIVNSYLVLDLERTPGMSLNQIAAFATMHLLLDLSEEAPDVSRSSSILRLFSGDNPESLPPELSRFDRLMLEGLYQPKSNDLSAGQQRGRMAQHISKNEDEE